MLFKNVYRMSRYTLASTVNYMTNRLSLQVNLLLSYTANIFLTLFIQLVAVVYGCHPVESLEQLSKFKVTVHADHF